MTAVDPRVGEIEARSDDALMYEGLNASVYAELAWASARDVPYLLAELRKRDEALAAVAEAQARAYDKGYTHGRHDGELSHFSRVQRPPKSRKNPYRAAVTGDGA